MGTQQVKGQLKGEQQRSFMRSLLNDLHALEELLNEGMIEEGVRRIGGEQELFLVDHNWRPASKALAVLDVLKDPQFTTELGQFNLELNLDPLLFGGDCLSRMEAQLNERLQKLRVVTEELGLQYALTGILPTLLKSDLHLNNMTPLPRYRELNRALTRLRGGSYDFHIKGLDELNVKHNSVMLESANCSFQIHFQVGAKEFANLYNIAQLVAAPVLAVAVNSPILFGLRLWKETRIALFQQSVDTRGKSHFMRDTPPRVFFGDDWVRESVLEIFRDDVTRFRALVGLGTPEDPKEAMAAGEAPKLSALRLHNGTVYRWNRPCYGITEGKPHLRIENRVLPSGPSVVDQMANSAFWFGLISGLSHKYERVDGLIDFGEVKMNFLAAARLGVQSQLTWFDGKTMSTQRLVLDHLLPLAEEGLALRNIDEADSKRYLGVIQKRVETEQTGAAWALRSVAAMGTERNLNERLNALVAATIARQKDGTPVAEWKLASLDEAGGWKHNFLRVEQFMTTELFTVHEDEPVDLVANLMKWKRIRHVLVEDHRDRLCGLVSYRALLRLMASGWGNGRVMDETVAVADVMQRDPICVSPETPALRAIEIMREFKIACLPVIKKDRLVGVVTERDFMDVAADLLAQKLKE